MNNYKLTLQYDGTNYSGWQIQKNAPSVQQTLTDSIKTILKEEVNLIGSGRTDAGVHALGQVANFKTETELDIRRFMHSMNSILPRDIAVASVDKAEENFHSRFDAKKRSYIYLLGRNKSPFYYSYSYNYHGEINPTKLNDLSGFLTGAHDFTSFCRKNSDTKNKICNVYEARWRETGGFVIFLISADRFLHGMVRTITGTLLNAVKTGGDEKYILDVMESKDRKEAGEAVPPQGLFLYKVRY